MQPPQTSFSHIQQMEPSEVAAYSVWRELDPATMQNYNTLRVQLTSFYPLWNNRHDVGGCFNATATGLIQWLGSLAGSVTVKTMNLYLAGIKSSMLDLGIECTGLCDPH